MTKGQKKELDSILEFLPKPNNYPPITDQDIQDYFDYTERGKKTQTIDQYAMNGFNALIQARRWRGIHINMYEEGVLSGDMPYIVILEGATPRTAEFLANNMFRGKDKKRILELYKSMC